MNLGALRSRVLDVAKFAVAHALYFSGLLWIYTAWKLRRAAVVLMYHRVLPAGPADSFSSAGIVVTPETFERQMSLLRRRFRLIRPGDLSQVLRGERALQPMTCMVTFDDGWFDNHAHALPILVRHEVPATVFVATEFVGTDRCFWQERMTRLLFEASRSGKAAEVLEEIGAPHVRALSQPAARHAVRKFVATRKTLQPADLAAWIDDVTRRLAGAGVRETGTGQDRFMTWEEVKTLADSGVVTLGSHACSHRPLTRLDESERRHELLESRRHIEARTNAAIEALAFPDGAHDAQTIEDARAAGYSVAFTTIGGLVRPGDDPLCVRRVNVHESATRTTAGFLCRIAGLF